MILCLEVVRVLAVNYIDALRLVDYLMVEEEPAAADGNVLKVGLLLLEGFGGGGLGGGSV